MKNQFIVEWNAEKCPNPEDCANCLEVCPEAVFAMYPPDREEGKLPERYIIKSPMQYFCSGCGECTEVCPNNALTISAKTPAQ